MSADLRAVLAEALKSVNVLLDGVVVSFSSTADLGLLADALATELRGRVVAASEVRPMSDDEMPKDREWTDLEWRLNQWHILHEFVESAEREGTPPPGAPR